MLPAERRAVRGDVGNGGHRVADLVYRQRGLVTGHRNGTESLGHEVHPGGDVGETGTAVAEDVGTLPDVDQDVCRVGEPVELLAGNPVLSSHLRCDRATVSRGTHSSDGT